MRPYQKLSDIPLHTKLRVYDIPGEHHWKCGLEWNVKFLHGSPHFVIYSERYSSEDKNDYLFQLDTDTEQYELIDFSEDHHALTDKGFRLEEEVRRKLYPEQVAHEERMQELWNPKKN